MPGASDTKSGSRCCDDRRFAANHHAVAALEAPDAAARPHVHVVDPLRGELLRAPDVVDVVRIATVDQDVVWLEQRHEIVDARVHDRGRDHQPDGTRLTELLHQLGERRGPCAPCRGRAPSPRSGLRSYTTHVWPIAQQTTHHVGAHPAETDHSELHHGSFLKP